ncbi:MAG: glycosyltransferase family 4 protein [Calditrichaeota bacterium]|nr:glycosyltransferase family 4 protein [Calditrichota bacterium]
MNLLVFTHAFLPVYGGLEKFLHELARSLISKGHRVTVLTWKLDPSSPFEEVMDGIAVSRFSSMKDLLNRISAMKQRHTFDLAVVAEPSGKHVLVSRTIRRELRIPLLLNLLGTASETAPRWAKVLNSHYATHIVACSQYCAKMFGFGKSKTRVIPHGIPAASIRDRFTPVIHPLKALCTCRIVRRKGLETLIRAAAMSPMVEYRIVGNPDLDPEYTRELESLKLRLSANNVEFLGRIDEETLRREYEQANIFVLPTLHEMFGIVFIEAMAAGLPVISTNATAIPEVVTEDCGFLIKPGDASGLAEHILNFQDPRFHERFARGALARAASFCFESTVERYLDAFESMRASQRST